MVASEGRPEHPLLSLNLRGNQDCPHRKTVGYSLRTRDYVGVYARMLVGEEFYRCGHSPIGFHRESGASCHLADLYEETHELGRWFVDAGNSLYSLDYDRSKLIGRQCLAGSLDIVDRDEDHVVGLIERSLNSRIIGRGYGPRRAPVESLGESEHLLPPGGKTMRASGRSHWPQPRSCKETGNSRRSRKPFKLFSKLRLKGIDHGVGIKSKPPCLTGYSLHIAGMGMAYRYDGMASVKIEIVSAVLGEDVGAFPGHRLDVV